jgi:heme exporter protein A
MIATARMMEVSRRYGKRWALIRASLDIPSGSAMLLTGENGAGKTTMLRVLATALAPTRGRLELFGRAVQGNRDAVRARLGLMTHTSHLYEDLSARENLRLVSRFQPSAKSSRIDGILERVGLLARADSPVRTFSAGMQRRLCMARILLRQPELLLLDEPFGQLDPAGVALVEEVICELKANGVTMVISTHDIERGEAICDLRVHLSQGRLRGAPRPIAQRQSAGGEA